MAIQEIGDREDGGDLEGKVGSEGSEGSEGRESVCNLLPKFDTPHM